MTACIDSCDNCGELSVDDDDLLVCFTCKVLVCDDCYIIKADGKVLCVACINCNTKQQEKEATP